MTTKSPGIREKIVKEEGPNTVTRNKPAATRPPETRQPKMIDFVLGAESGCVSRTIWVIASAPANTGGPKGEAPNLTL